METPGPLLLPAQRQHDGLSRVAVLELLSEVSARVARSLDLQKTLEHICDAVVDCLGFGAAVLNLCRPDGVAVAVARGPQELVRALSGDVQTHEVWAELLRRSEPRGGLRFIDGRGAGSLREVHIWVPDLPVDDDPESWHPLDALFAPLHGASGDLVGILSVDLPRDGRRPLPDRLELLERFAVQAALAMDRARMHGELAASAELFAATFANAPIGMVLLADDGSVLQANAGASRFLDDDRPQGRACWDLVDGRDRTLTRRTVRGVVRSRVGTSGRVRSADGTRTADVVLTPLLDRAQPCTLVQLTDVTEQLHVQRSLQRQATTDGLTGLANRSSVHERLARLARTAHLRPVAVLFCDLDDFKLVNDSFGHAVGDDLLVQVSRSLVQCLRDGDLAGRVGGDEFVVVLDGIQGPAEAIALAERIGRAIGERVSTPDGQLTPSASIGIAFADDVSSADELLAQADAALYDAKAGGRGRWELYTPALRARARDQLLLREELLRAVERDEFRLEYQPIIELGTGLTAGYEALLRWEHPVRGRLLPETFLGELLDGSLATPVTDWVFDRALGDAASWPAVDGQLARVSVNISPCQLGRSDFPARLERLLLEHGLDPDRVCVEVTEDAVVDGARELSTLDELQALGVHLAVDDFGSGYAGLLSLRDVPADVVKLDRAFTDHMLTDEVSRNVVEVVVDLCTRLGRDIVAEGIESAEQAEALRALGVRYGQGWHLGRPRPIERLDRAVPPVLSPVPVTDDLDGELRRLDAALAATRTAAQAGVVTLQAASRVVGSDGGSLVLLDAEGELLHLAHAEGYSQEVVNRFLVFDLDTPMPLSQAVRTREQVWWAAVDLMEPLHLAVPGDERPLVTLGALPLVRGEQVVGGLGISWSTPVAIDEALRRHLGAMADRLAAHLLRL